MKQDVDFDINIPDNEPPAVLSPDEVEETPPALEADGTEEGEGCDDAAEDGEEDCAEAKDLAPIRRAFRQLSSDDEFRFNKQTLRDLVSGATFVMFLRYNWKFLLVLVAYLLIYVSLGYHHRNLLIENDKLNRAVLDRRYKALTRSSELRERTLGSKIEQQLEDSTIQSSTDAPFVLPVDVQE